MVISVRRSGDTLYKRDSTTARREGRGGREGGKRVGTGVVVLVIVERGGEEKKRCVKETER